MDVVTQGSFAKAGRFRYSDRWRTYNAIAVMSEKGLPVYDGPLPGYCCYPNIVKHNVAISELEVLGHDFKEADILGYEQFDLFQDYAGGSVN